MTQTTDLTNVPCPTCGGPTRLRTGSRGDFFGCQAFPRCRGSIDALKALSLNATPHPAADPPTSATGPASASEEPAPAPVVTGSPEQQAIWSQIAQGGCHVVVKALAGTGKSFTCREAMKATPSHLRVLYLAFNKSIAQEFSEGAPRHAQVATLNATGWRIVREAFPKALLDNDKVTNLLKEIYQPETPEDVANLRIFESLVERLVGLAQGDLVSNESSLRQLAERHELQAAPEVLDRALALVPTLLDLSRERPTVVSFNDQLWLPVELNLPTPKFDLIFVDEAQDLNRLQHHLVLRLLAPRGRVVIVGDDHQAIYGFRGSDVDSINNFTALLQQHTNLPVHTLPLTVTRRCPQRVVEAAQQFVPEFQSLPDAPEGEVNPSLELDDATARMRPGDLGICRTNAPLTSVAFRLIQRGTRAVVRGRDIGQGLQALIQKLRPSSPNDLLVKLDDWQSREMEKVRGTRNEESLVQALVDKADCVRVLVQDADSISEVLARIAEIFANFEPTGAPRSAVVLSSIHRAKGLEAQTVWWLFPEISCKANQEWQQKQEDNLRYVALTRAKSVLNLIKQPRG